MAKSSNPLQDFQRQQRKKEKQKNKVKRISARDAKVAQTASLEGIKKEIEKLTTKQEHQNGHLDNTDTRKLERLRKELKIVIQAEEDRKKQREERERLEWEAQKERMKTKEGVDELNQNKFRNARASVYYDPVMNPFGAPPPGKPMLYHRRGGGTTMDPSEAFIPYEYRDEKDDEQSVKDQEGKMDVNTEENIEMHSSSCMIPPVPVQAPLGVENSVAYKTDLHSQLWYDPHALGKTNGPVIPPPPPPRNVNAIPPPPPPPRSLPVPPPPPPPPPPHPVQLPPPPPPPPKSLPLPTTNQYSETKVKSTSSCLPTLPAPSQSVQRLHRQKSKKTKRSLPLSDIWASQEEVDYEGGALEGASDAIPPERNATDVQPSFKRKRKGEQKDENFDPLCPADEGYSDYRSKEQIQRSNRMQKRDVGGDNKDENAGDAQGKRESELNNTNGDDCCNDEWFYIDQSGTLQGPFQSEQMVGWNQAGFFPSNTLVKNGPNGRFVEMRLVDLATGQMKQDQDSEGVEDRIAMLKQSMMMVNEEEISGVDDRIATLQNRTDDASVDGVEDRIAALKTEQPIHAEIPSYPIITLHNEHENEIPSYPPITLHNEDENEIPSYPSITLHNEDENEMPSYPSITLHNEDENEMPSYPMVPLHNDLHAGEPPRPYPIHDEHDTIPYPTMVAYPEVPAIQDNILNPPEQPSSQYYPDTNTITPNNAVTQPKAIYQGDKEVVGFIPSNVRIRRSAPSTGGKMKRSIKGTKITNPASVSLSGSTNKKSIHHEEKNSIVPSQTSVSVAKDQHDQKNGVADDYEKFMEEINALR